MAMLINAQLQFQMLFKVLTQAGVSKSLVHLNRTGGNKFWVKISGGSRNSGVFEKSEFYSAILSSNEEHKWRTLS